MIIRLLHIPTGQFIQLRENMGSSNWTTNMSAVMLSRLDLNDIDKIIDYMLKGNFRDDYLKRHELPPNYEFHREEFEVIYD